MKHNKLSISIVSAFIAALGLTACSNVATEHDKALVTIKGYDNQEIEITADEMYNKLLDSEDGVTSFYNAILEVMIRDYFENNNDKTKYNGFVQTAKDKVTADHKKAKDDAKTNGTDYDTEWQAILDANGVKDEDELFQKHLYTLEKEEYVNNFFDNAESKKALTSEFIGFDENGKAYEVPSREDPSKNVKATTSVYPYHIRHILVKTEGTSATDYVTSEITKDQATKLADVYKLLAKGSETFGQVAKLKSDDGSKTKFGDAGIMTTKTSFVNEFKLGIYAYDCIYANEVTGKKELKDSTEKLGLGLNYRNTNETVADKMSNIGLAEVPFAAFEFLGEKADVTLNEKGNKVNDGLARYYPRNIVWNQYLNLHNPFVITDVNTIGEDMNIDGTIVKATYTAKAIDEEATAGHTGFRTIPGVADGHKVLTDEDGRVIVGVRSEFGIHFMVMERTPFEINGTIIGRNDAGYVYDDTNINEYYTTATPGREAFPKTEDKVEKNTYVNHLNGSATDYAERANTIKGEIKGFDKMYDYRIFEFLRDQGRIQINNENGVADAIDKLIDSKRENIEWTDLRDINNAWNSYIDKLDRQQEARNSDRLINPVCATNFEAGNDALFGEDGICYYEA